jgi:hypothetical protein
MIERLSMCVFAERGDSLKSIDMDMNEDAIRLLNRRKEHPFDMKFKKCLLGHFKDIALVRLTCEV